jgi:malate dehydrogenase (oxaloacetate-decarboxylating)
LDVRAKEINDEMKLAAAYAIAGYIDEKDLNEEYIIPDVLDKKVAQVVAEAVKDAARKTGMARI